MASNEHGAMAFSCQLLSYRSRDSKFKLHGVMVYVQGTITLEAPAACEDGSMRQAVQSVLMS